MITTGDLVAELVRRGFTDVGPEHPEPNKRRQRWCYALGDWGVNYGIGKMWDQAHFETPAYHVRTPHRSHDIGTIVLFHGQFTDPGIKHTPVAGGMLVGDSFDSTDYDGTAPDALTTVANRIESLIRNKELSEFVEA